MAMGSRGLGEEAMCVLACIFEIEFDIELCLREMAYQGDGASKATDSRGLVGEVEKECLGATA